MNELVLTQDQQAAYEAFIQFILDPMKSIFVLEGYAGTGKSTLVNKMISDLDSILRTAKLIDPDTQHTWDILLTATTNKAAEALSQITNQKVVTIQSLLGLKVVKNYQTGKSSLRLKNFAEIIKRSIIFIDEASYYSEELLRYTLQRTEQCKLIFIGDPAQLTSVGYRSSPVFNKGFQTVRLTEVMRQTKNNPIMEAATAFRDWVITGEPKPIKLDGEHLVYLDRGDFSQAVIQEFTRADWKFNESKILTWTNKAVVSYNSQLRELASGSPIFRNGDYAICNSYVQNGSGRIPTDSLVMIREISPATDMGVDGFKVYLEGYLVPFFLPKDFNDKKKTVNRIAKDGDFSLADEIDKTWIDLRAAYACTINKSQGSTYDKVFIDLEDIKKCASGDQIARMLYVAVSRAREKAYFTGDFV